MGIDENNEFQSAQFVTRFSMAMPDGNTMHVHTIYGFKATDSAIEQNDNVHVLKGTATLTMKNVPVAVFL